jgi:hypothetical protein
MILLVHLYIGRYRISGTGRAGVRGESHSVSTSGTAPHVAHHDHIPWKSAIKTLTRIMNHQK